MDKWITYCCIFVLTTIATSSPNLQSGLGMKQAIRPKRRPNDMTEDDRQMVTIDLSALRPSLPGLVLYKYGEQAPKLVQIDLSSLNPQLQPHVIWPQFDQMELFNERSLDFDSLDAIPYLTDDESLIPSKPRMAKMAMARKDDESWPDMDDLTDGDIYDFLPDSRRNDELMSLHGSLPLADEVIVPLDWEEKKTLHNSAKRNIFLSNGWQAGGLRGTGKIRNEMTTHPATARSPAKPNVQYTPFGYSNWIPGKRKQGRETESEDMKDEPKVSQTDKKNVFLSSGWGPGGQQVSSMAAARRHGSRRRVDGKSQPQTAARISSQESWSIPRQYWNVPHLLGSPWH